MPRRPLAAGLVALLALAAAPALGDAAARADAAAPAAVPAAALDIRPGAKPRPDVHRVRPSDGRATRVLPKQRALASSGPSTAQQQSATALSTWQVTYGPGFNGRADARAAFQRAVDTWSRSVVSSVPIVVRADLSRLGRGVLGEAGPSDGALCRAGDLLYPEALLNASTGTDNDRACGNVAPDYDGSDITATFSDQDLFYFGADPAGIGAATCTGAGSGCYDFQSVVLHEIAHGLGVLGSAFGDNRTKRGIIGYAGVPTVYDAFVKTSDGRYVAEDFAQNSRALYDALVGSRLFWDGPEAAGADRGREPQIWAPNDPGVGFEDGTSFTHLDDIAYPSGDPDGLMTPYAEPRDVDRDPGEVTLGLLRDIGWVTPRPAGARYVPLDPVRILDTAAGAVATGAVATVQPQSYGVPPSATAVVLNVTSAGPTSVNAVRVFPRGRRATLQPVPALPSLHTAAGDTRANLVTVPTGAGGQVRLRSDGGRTRLVADLLGYYLPTCQAASGSCTPPGSGFALASRTTRVLDTRTGLGAPRRRVGPGGFVDLQVAGGATGGGLPGVPATATAVVLTLTAVRPTVSTHLQAYPTPRDAAAAPPDVSNINLRSGTVAANQVVVKIGDGGRARIRNAAGELDVVADLVGWYDTAVTRGEYHPTRPTRRFDTRPGTPLSAGSTRPVGVAGERSPAGVPPGAGSVVAELTGVGPTTATYLTAYPSTTSRPDTSNLNLGAGQTAAVHAVVGLGSTGGLTVYNAAGTVDAIVDVFGWFSPA